MCRLTKKAKTTQAPTEDFAASNLIPAPLSLFEQARFQNIIVFYYGNLLSRKLLAKSLLQA
jgi:hypothetical protein